MHSRPWRCLLLALVACLLASSLLVPAVTAQGQVDDSEDVDDLEPPEASATGEYDAADGGGTEVVSSGEDVEESEEDLQLTAAPGVQTVAILPAHVGKVQPILRAGQTSELLFGINNEASGPIKIAGILSKLYVPYDYRIVAQNFTGELPSNLTLINATVPKGAQSSFSLHFTPFKLLQPMTFGLAATLYYELEGAQYASVLYNSTVEVVEPLGAVSGETIFLVLLGVGILALVGMWASAQLENLSKRAKRSKKVETGTGDQADLANNEWLQGTFFNVKQGSGQGAKQRKRR